VAIRVARRLAVQSDRDLAKAMLFPGLPGYLRWDNGPEFVAQAIAGDAQDGNAWGRREQAVRG